MRDEEWIKINTNSPKQNKNISITSIFIIVAFLIVMSIIVYAGIKGIL